MKMDSCAIAGFCTKAKKRKTSARFSACPKRAQKHADPITNTPPSGHPLGGGLLRQDHSQHDQNEAEVGLCLGVFLEVDRDDNRLVWVGQGGNKYRGWKTGRGIIDIDSRSLDGWKIYPRPRSLHVSTIFNDGGLSGRFSLKPIQ